MIVDLHSKSLRRRSLCYAFVLLALFALGLRPEAGLSVTAQNSGAIRSGNPDRAQVSLMINVDWGEEYLPRMLEVLHEKNVHTTFFVVGRWARKNPDLLREIASKGHEIASHGDQHKMATRLNDSDLDALISDGASALRDILGKEPAPLFAPPSGDCDERVVSRAAFLGYRTVLWTLDTVDWKRPPATTIVSRIVPKAENGCLVLMHPTEPTLAALPVLIDQLRAKGLEPVTVSETLTP